MEATEKGFKLSTGREFYANFSELSLGPLGDGETRLHIAYGHDGGVDLDYPYTDEPAEQFTVEERKEIAAYMVDLWTRWGNQPLETTVPD